MEPAEGFILGFLALLAALLAWIAGNVLCVVCAVVIFCLVVYLVCAELP